MKTFNMHEDEARRLQALQDHVNRTVGAANKTCEGWYGKNDVLKLLLDLAQAHPLKIQRPAQPLQQPLKAHSTVPRTGTVYGTR